VFDVRHAVLEETQGEHANKRLPRLLVEEAIFSAFVPFSEMKKIIQPFASCDIIHRGCTVTRPSLKPDKLALPSFVIWRESACKKNSDTRA
jgi:hypothetical protein